MKLVDIATYRNRFGRRQVSGALEAVTSCLLEKTRAWDKARRDAFRRRLWGIKITAEYDWFKDKLVFHVIDGSGELVFSLDDLEDDEQITALFMTLQLME